MAPHLAIAELSQLAKGSVVLDPMAGSGTVLRQAAECGHVALGFDLDPLAVLMSRVWTTPVKSATVSSLLKATLQAASKLKTRDVALPWIDKDQETRDFCQYWFAPTQRNELRKIAFVLWQVREERQTAHGRAALNVLQLALSRTIVTKDQGASLARDVSHSRPHKVAEKSKFRVMPAFERSVETILRYLEDAPPHGGVVVEIGDARSLKVVENRSIDLVLTSPPYLNAIDYMRGHRMALIWLGHKLVDLRKVRSSSIGAERAPDSVSANNLFDDVHSAMVATDVLPSRHSAMVARYAEDLYRMMSEIKRVLKRNGRAVLVVGDSCLKGIFIKNSAGVVQAAKMVGLRLLKKRQRRLPDNKRYLPMPTKAAAPLGGRMRTESILTFAA